MRLSIGGALAPLSARWMAFAPRLRIGRMRGSGAEALPSPRLAPALSRRLSGEDGRFPLDEQTVFDLGLDALSRRINHSLTSPGDEFFYHYLHSQPRERGDGAGFGELLDVYRSDPGALSALREVLASIGRQERGSLVDDLWDSLPRPFASLAWVPWWFGLNLALLVLPLSFLGGAALVFPVIPLLALDIFLFTRSNPVIGAAAGSIRYLSRIVMRFRKAARDPRLASAPRLVEAEALCRATERVVKYRSYFGDGLGGGSDPLSMLLDYLRVFFLAELFAYSRTIGAFEALRGEVRALVLLVGELDAAQSVARLLEEGRGSVKASRASVGDRSKISAEGLFHPLVPDCVGNDVELLRGLIVTGLNMAGKSTFLRSLALNQVMATSFGVAFASRFETGDFLVLTSLGISDDLLGGRSKYFAEAERLLFIMETARREKALCLVDEILTGTNGTERVLASIKILRDLAAARPSIAVAATHDLAIAEGLAGEYDRSFFDGSAEGERLVFDYRIKPGVASGRNALLILRHLGFEV